LSSVKNYRPITLSPIISKIFESVLLIKYAMYLNVNDREFGFRNGLGCNNAIFILLLDFTFSATGGGELSK